MKARNCSANFPEEDYETLQDYLKEIDWTDDEVFWNTFFRTPIGMRVKQEIRISSWHRMQTACS